MPIFEYKCRGCENRFEYLLLSSSEEIICPECDSANVEKLFSTFGVKSENTISSSIPVSSGCGCTPVSCGCGVKH